MCSQRKNDPCSVLMEQILRFTPVHHPPTHHTGFLRDNMMMRLDTQDVGNSHGYLALIIMMATTTFVSGGEGGAKGINVESIIYRALFPAKTRAIVSEMQLF